MKRAVHVVVLASFTFGLGCGSEYTITDRSTLVISDNSRISAESILPGGQKNPKVARHLGLAQEVYNQQLNLLKERRNKVRARRRTMSLLSYSVLAASGIVVGAIALGSTSHDTLRAAGGGAMGGVALGTGLQIGSIMQEDPSAVDDKIRHLQGIYDGMAERVRILASQPTTDQGDAQMGSAIESFINEALQINVKG
jgi:hypothetical protein